MKAAKALSIQQDDLDPISDDVKKSQPRDAWTSLDEESPDVEQSPDSQKSLPKRRRKVHRKSRNGCFNCKKARHKCNEKRPACDYCLHRSFHCQWPEAQTLRVWKATAIPTIDTFFNPSTPVFTMLDFRLFSHFIKSAYPKHPIDNGSIWTHEIPCIASDYEYLLHSILALSASDLTIAQPSSPELKNTALTYRIKAITSLGTAISFGIQSFQEGNAMLATCYNLFVQSVLLEDGLIEYMTFLRGVIAIGVQMVDRSMKILFHSMWAVDDSLSALHLNLNNAPLIDPKHVSAACLSLETIQHLCVKNVEVEIYGLLLSMARALFTSSRDAFLQLRKVYGHFAYIINYEQFREFTDSTNDVGKLLQAHLIALQLIMAPISKMALNKTAFEEKVDQSSEARWLGSLLRNISKEMVKLYQWPLAVEKEAQNRLLARKTTG